MKKFTEYQKNFILEHFFKNDAYAGWKSIAAKLLEGLQCVVAGEKCIWNGGVGNFIKTETAKDFFGCLIYKFDSDSFFTSEWYKSIRDQYASILDAKKSNIEKECEEIAEI